MSYPLPAPPMGYPLPQPRAPQDGWGIAALVTGILGLGPVPLALGIAATRRRRARGLGSGMGLAGIILGSIQIGLYLLVGGVLLAATASGNTERAALRAECAAGEMTSCDDLYVSSPLYSDDEAFADTCAGRHPVGSGMSCDELDNAATIPLAYGDDPTLDALYDDCEAGDLTACDDLYAQSPGSSAYLDFGGSCGDRGSDSRWCVNDRGDDPELDALYDGCAAGNWESCDTLYELSRPGSGYEAFADSCGNRTDGGEWCTQVEGLDPNV
ncbi:DUF4190 domain-containing protein [Cellulomonas sp. NPDC089187]|uniref:DUF4190 domain-containing protein n=1 Tax=Cellulomonas sp. NPDC089187 TaxID=3154970 RepID=UPI003439C8F1